MRPVTVTTGLKIKLKNKTVRRQQATIEIRMGKITDENVKFIWLTEGQLIETERDTCCST